MWKGRWLDETRENVGIFGRLYDAFTKLMACINVNFQTFTIRLLECYPVLQIAPVPCIPDVLPDILPFA